MALIAALALAAGLLAGGAAHARPALASPLPAPRIVTVAPVAQPAPTTASLFPGAAMAAMPAPRGEPDAPPPPARPAGLTGAFAYAVIDLATGALLDAHEPDHALAPASVAKIPTALYALAHLGPEHRFATRVLATGPVRDGVLHGDLILEGGGEPALDSDALATLAGTVAARITRVEGRLRISHGDWPVMASIAEGQPVRASYNPAVAGLNLNFNRVRLAWTRNGAAVNARLEAHAARSSPTVARMALRLEGPDCGCPGFAHDVSAALDAPMAETWRVRESVLTGAGAVWLPVRRPGDYAADVFAAVAAAHGLALAVDPVPVPVPANATVLATHLGASAAVQIGDMLRYSTNLSAELLGLAAARAAGHAPGDLAASAAAMADWAAGYAGLPAGGGGFRLANHSGLSTEGVASPRALATLLRAAHRDGRLGQQLVGLLREHGASAQVPDGTRIRAKTGTMYFTRALAGFITTPSGRDLAFVVIANDHRRRPAGPVPEGPPPGTRAWRNAAIAHENALLAQWARIFDGG